MVGSETSIDISAGERCFWSLLSPFRFVLPGISPCKVFNICSGCTNQSKLDENFQRLILVRKWGITAS